MAESADALDSGSSGSNTVCVQVTLSAPKNAELIFKFSVLSFLKSSEHLYLFVKTFLNF